MIDERPAGRPQPSGPLGGMSPLRDPHIQLMYLPGCPLVGRVRATLQASLASIGSHATVEEIEGSCASPTLLIDGVDVTGRTPPPSTSCRLDLPSKEQILKALTRLAADA